MQMEDISCITQEARERDPREHPFKRNMVASDPDGMVSDPDGMIKALESGDAPFNRNIARARRKEQGIS